MTKHPIRLMSKLFGAPYNYLKYNRNTMNENNRAHHSHSKSLREHRHNKLGLIH